jgi:hypothetical protein
LSELDGKHQVRVRYRYLFDFLIVHFGEDWFDEYPDEAASIADFIAHAPADQRQGTLGELMQMVRETPSPDQFERDFHYLCWAYRPGIGPSVYREFADRIAEQLQASLADDAG